MTSKNEWRMLLWMLMLLCAFHSTPFGTSTQTEPADMKTSSRKSAPPEPSRRRPVFLKFYKVGSESVVDFFLRMSVDPRMYKSWVAKTPECDGLPMVSE